MTRAIDLQESARLIELEGKIRSGLQTFVEVGEALAEIRDSMLYLVEHETFEEYCKVKWNMSRPRVYQLIGAAKAASIVSTMVDIDSPEEDRVLPQSERQARPLTKLPAEQQPVAWEKAVEKANGEQPTAKQVEEAVVEVMEPESAPKPTPQIKYIPALGLQTADNAIRMLDTITKNDSQRKEALEKVAAYCARHLK